MGRSADERLHVPGSSRCDMDYDKKNQCRLDRLVRELPLCASPAGWCRYSRGDHACGEPLRVVVSLHEGLVVLRVVVRLVGQEASFSEPVLTS